MTADMQHESSSAEDALLEVEPRAERAGQARGPGSCLKGRQRGRGVHPCSLLSLTFAFRALPSSYQFLQSCTPALRPACKTQG